MYKKNRIKEMIDNGQIPLGMQCFTGDPPQAFGAEQIRRFDQ